MTETFLLSTLDYAILGVMLVVSAGIGLYFRIFGGQQKSNVDYLLAGKDMSIFPVSFSLMATFMSATTLMGIPSEMYIYGTNMAFMNIGFLMGPIISSIIFLPIYFNTGVSTAYEYLEKRFGKTTRRTLSLIYLFQAVLFNSVCLYAPALALNAVTNLSMWTSVISIGAVCTFYCTIGGMKAVLWTDVFQSVLMYICLLAIIVKGCLDIGGLENVFKIAYDGGRMIAPTFKMDFSKQYTMWNVFLVGLIITTYNFGSSQTHVQRQLTLKTLQRAKIATFLSAPMLVVFHLLCCACGLIFYSYFEKCDPLTSPDKPIHSADQLLPYYIVSAMSEYPGLPGLCVAGVFSAALSTVSSAVNSMAAVTYEDIIRPLWPNPSRSVLLTKIASAFYGVLSILLAFLVASLGNLIQINVLLSGIVSGPILGVYLLAALTKTANELGVNLGALSGFILAACAVFIPNNRQYPQLPVKISCSNFIKDLSNISAINDHWIANTTDLPTMVSKTNTLSDNFPVSYMWIAPLSLLICLIVGYFGSWIYSFIRGTSESVSSELMAPVVQRYCCREKRVDIPKTISHDQITSKV